MKVLIADDEKKICALIKSLIDWEGMGLELVGIATNGIEALEMAEKLQPHIIITDIKMPGMDGIALIENAQRLQLKSQFIMISGYKQFEYAHSAIRFGVQSYILKPIDKEELHQALMKAKTAIEKTLAPTDMSQKKKIQQYFLENMMIRQEQTYMELEDVNSTFELDFKQGVFQAFFLRVDSLTQTATDLSHIQGILYDEMEKVLSNSSIEYIIKNMEHGLLTVVNFDAIYLEEKKDFLQILFKRLLSITEKFAELNLTLGVGVTSASIEKVYLSIKSSIDAIKIRSFIGTNRIINFNVLDYSYEGMKILGFETVKIMMEVAVEALCFEDFDQCFSRMIEENKEQYKKNPLLLLKIFSVSEEIILKKLHELKVNEQELNAFHQVVEQGVYNEISEMSMLYRFRLNVRDLLTKIQEYKKNQQRLPLREAKKYIASHYHEPITLEEVAEAINLSQAYLSTLFKTESGVTFSDFLTECRLNAAKDLLKNSQKSISDITEAIGYRDQKHFSKLFKKLTGIKPTSYRSLYGGGEDESFKTY